MNIYALRNRWRLACIGMLMQAVCLPSAYSFALLGNAEFSSAPRWSDSVLQQGLTFGIGSGFLAGASGDPSTAIRNAFSTWDAASTRINFTETSFVYQSPRFGANIDVFSESPDFTYAGVGFNGALAITLVSVGFSGSILGADVYFNEAYAFSDGPGSAFDIESVGLHELGHALGIGHPDEADDLDRNYDSLGTPVPAEGSEIMHSTIAPGEVNRVLTGDEIAALYYLYPSDDYSYGSTVTSTAITPASVPEPGTLPLIITGGLAGLLSFGIGRRNAHREEV